MPNPHLHLAELAIQYVNAHTIRSSNRDSERLPDTDTHIAAMDFEFMHTEQPLNDAKDETKRWAQLGLAHRVGNCQVKAAVAFDFLARLAAHPKLELMSLNQAWHGADTVTANVTGLVVEFAGPDHVFVVIGRVSGHITDYTGWNPDAVVCDPWSKRCYLAGKLGEEMGLLTSVTGGATATTQMLELSPTQAW